MQPVQLPWWGIFNDWILTNSQAKYHVSKILFNSRYSFDKIPYQNVYLNKS